MLSLCPVVTQILSYNNFLFQLEAFCNEAFGIFSAYRHYETKKKE